MYNINGHEVSARLRIYYTTATATTAVAAAKEAAQMFASASERCQRVTFTQCHGMCVGVCALVLRW